MIMGNCEQLRRNAVQVWLIVKRPISMQISEFNREYNPC